MSVEDYREKIEVYLWMDLGEDDPRKPKYAYPEVSLRNMLHRDVRAEYDADANARAFAKLIISSVPGSTLDRLLKVMADEIRPMLDHPEILKAYGDLEGRIRVALLELAHQEEPGYDLENVTNFEPIGIDKATGEWMLRVYYNNGKVDTFGPEDAAEFMREYNKLQD